MAVPIDDISSPGEAFCGCAGTIIRFDVGELLRPASAELEGQNLEWQREGVVQSRGSSWSLVLLLK
jgi:hypothetical protein